MQPILQFPIHLLILSYLVHVVIVYGTHGVLTTSQGYREMSHRGRRRLNHLLVAMLLVPAQILSVYLFSL
jgi:hypothetical protein